jgi:hypothetical protein
LRRMLLVELGRHCPSRLANVSSLALYYNSL